MDSRGSTGLIGVSSSLGTGRGRAELGDILRRMTITTITTLEGPALRVGEIDINND